jgi:hypothetical protein
MGNDTSAGQTQYPESSVGATMFPGFFRPRSSFFKLPNDWFDIWAAVRRMSGRSRILALLKIVEYVIKWTWGYQNYAEPVRISRRDFHRGRRKGARILDRGTRLSSRSIELALDLLVKLGLLEEAQGDADDGPSFIPRLRPEAEEWPGFLGDDVPLAGTEGSYRGFDLPQANFFVVPAMWTDLTSDIDSEAAILAVEYFFRHTWGWQGGWDEPCWMDVDDVAGGRPYRSPERRGERYDRGIGYSVKYTRNALNDAVFRGWLVWRDKESGRGREYALHLKGMHVSQDGRFLDPDEEAVVRPRTVQPVNVAPNGGASDTTDAKIAHLQAQVAALTQMVETLIELLHRSGVDVSIALGDESTGEREQSKALGEQSKALAEQSTAPQGAKYSTSYTDAASDTLSKTPPPDTLARAATTNGDDADDGQNGGGGVIASSLLDRLTSLETPMSPDAASDLLSAYGEQSVRAWLDILERDPTVRSVPALLIHKLREGETPPKPRRNCQRTSDSGNRGSTIFRKPPVDEANDPSPEEIERRRVVLTEHRKRRAEQKKAEAEGRAE